ncbi:TPA: CRISPR-associated endonuclease Cas2 [bacterium]|nr:CRISPR-associated endonuclease Cas2 [bacterium]
MYIIVVYDVGEKRVARICKYLRQYLHWVQNSVFEGELTEGKYAEIKGSLKKLINADKDSILFYKLRADYDVQKDIIGLEKSGIETII